MFLKKAARQTVTRRICHQAELLHFGPHTTNTNRGIKTILWPSQSWHYQLYNGYKMDSITLLLLSACRQRRMMKPQKKKLHRAFLISWCKYYYNYRNQIATIVKVELSALHWSKNGFYTSISICGMRPKVQ